MSMVIGEGRYIPTPEEEWFVSWFEDNGKGKFKKKSFAFISITDKFLKAIVKRMELS